MHILKKIINGIKNPFRRHAKQLRILEQQNLQLAEKLKWVAIDNENIRARMEFIRKEVMFEVQRQLRITHNFAVGNSSQKISPRWVNKEKINNLTLKKLNLGCGHIAKEDFINVDMRELPGIDVIADVTSLPFEPESIDTIYAAHLMEHFPEKVLCDVVLPHWFQLLKQGGDLIVIVPDAQAMIDEYVKNKFSFDELREVIFGGQEYEGDFHFTMFTPETMVGLLKESGFLKVDVITSGRKNGVCLEVEIHAKK